MYSLAVATTLFAAALAAPQPFFTRRGGSYVSYNGDGSTAEGWPAENQWTDFDSMWNGYYSIVTNSCGYFGVPNTSADEASEMKAAIQSVSQESGVDPRVIFAVIVQESKGCVRVWQTGNGVTNPGIMQDHAGTHMCNTAMSSPSGGVVQTPCPQDEIIGMIRDGTEGTSSGAGLEQLGGTSQNSKDIYVMARKYNSGENSLGDGSDLGANGATNSYCSDIANRLMGVVFDTSPWQHATPSNGGGSNPGSGGCTRDYTVQSGDYCYEIATNNNISVDTLEAWNPQANCNNLQIGTVMCVAH